MAAPKSTVWDLEPHTVAKHEILRHYLNAWVPIITKAFESVVFIDGFAGPGVYSKGEDGSPIIALKIAQNWAHQVRGKFTFRFVEKEPDRSSTLDVIVRSMKLPPNFDARVIPGEYEPYIQRFIAHFRKPGIEPQPTFAFIDPFGWLIPFEYNTQILSFQSCEVFVNFMYEEANRFLKHKDQKKNFDRLFGTDEWEECEKISDPRKRKRCLHDLYLRQLRQVAKAKFVRSFEMKNKNNSTDYYLFYATNSRRGLQRMKDAMWRVDPSGEFAFSDATDPNQMVMLGDEPNFRQLERELIKKFSGQVTTVQEIENFVVEETAFLETHYKTRVLRPMEKGVPPKIKALSPPPKRKPGFYPDWCKDMQIKFLE